ncbi:MAG: glycosyltransferase family 4 protein [Arenibacter troitsensis]|nr:glycosyltransferase family 4 protein [Arenibacter troitsensis]
MTKIAFLIGQVNNIGGIPRVVSLISDSLIKTGLFDIQVISYQKGNNPGYGWNDKIKFNYLLDNPMPLKKGIFIATMRLRKILKNEKIDLLITCGSLYGPLGVLSTRFLKTKTIYWDHSNFFENTSHQFKIESKKFTAFFADVVVPLTKRDKINYEKYTKAKLVYQIYNPIDSQLENLKHEYDKSSKRIISVGRLTDQKNFLLLVDVAKIVLNKHPDWKWDIYGSGPLEQKIKDKINDNKLNDSLFLKGQSNHLYSLYKEYSFMVMTSKYEGFPMTLLEGMSNKLPLISFDIETGPNEIIVENKNGFLVPSLSIPEMTSKIIELIENQEKRISFSKHNEKLIDSFNMNGITSRWISLFEQLKQ